MKYNAKIIVTGTVVNQYWIEVKADSIDEAEKKIEDGDYDIIDDYEVDYYDEGLDQILELELAHETD
jgi:hypothetical protein